MERVSIIKAVSESVAGLYPQHEAFAIACVAAEYFWGFSKAQYIAEPHAEAGDDEELLRTVCRQLAEARPVQYVTGCADFYGRNYAVNENVLIPRPETEELVHWIVADCRRLPQPRVLDVGTGSGAIAVSLALELPGSSVDAVDVSLPALEVAARNAHANGAAVNFRQADALAGTEVFCGALPHECYDVMVSNPPYIPASEYDRMCDNVRRYEPHTALFVPDDEPLVFYREIALQARRLLVAGGVLYFEVHESYWEEVCRLLESLGLARVECRNDINNKPRMVKCVKQ